MLGYILSIIDINILFYNCQYFPIMSANKKTLILGFIGSLINTRDFNFGKKNIG